jgi:hypothetical protein
MQELRKKLDSVDPRDVYFLKKMKLASESSLKIDLGAQPDKSYCNSWIQTQRSNPEIRLLIEEVANFKSTMSDNHQ